ncbi:hypothetical protein DPEC_G00328450 [Dallia pectoralis]|uniref:Uncharacterized protein n=1 Tax=Dallia pectoralis TaxID=75939 RepID=A0ACC2F8E8_DALPE|nr:hypothetical protein DPEC_G00328450 [Dallia pectoralis]
MSWNDTTGELRDDKAGNSIGVIDRVLFSGNVEIGGRGHTIKCGSVRRTHCSRMNPPTENVITTNRHVHVMNAFSLTGSRLLGGGGVGGLCRHNGDELGSAIYHCDLCYYQLGARIRAGRPASWRRGEGHLGHQRTLSPNYHHLCGRHGVHTTAFHRGQITAVVSV